MTRVIALSASLALFVTTVAVRNIWVRTVN
jgi:hypothetical protein